MKLTTKRDSPFAALAIAVPVIALIGWLDFESGPVAMSLLYFVPIVLTAWRSNLAAGIGAALCAGCAWVVSETAVGQHGSHIVAWNGFTRTATFVILAFMINLVRRDRDQLETLNNRLEEALELESRVARTDSLTGLANSRFFRESLDRELARSQREQTPIGIAYIDLDNFKKINDTLGHGAGDDALRRVAQALQKAVRAEDLPARLGGDEFAILCIRPTPDGLESIGERIRKEVTEIARDYAGTGFGCTTGLILFSTAPKDAVAAVREADELMYEIKSREKGRYEVRVSGSIPA